MFKFSKVTVAAVLFITAFSSLAIAQSNNQNTSQQSFDINYSAELGGFYFVDQAGLQIAISGTSLEGVIDKNIYHLGPNDLLTIEVESNQKYLFRAISVNSTGDILIPSFGIINLNGLTISEAEIELSKLFSDDLKEPVINVSLESPREIQIHVTGSIPLPGKYTLPANSRLDLAILQATIEQTNVLIGDTPTPQPLYTSKILELNGYSIRNISIERKNGDTKTYDLIKYFRTGDLANNPLLYDGDRISLKNTENFGPEVSISGAIKNEYNLEFKVNESISDLIDIGGGLINTSDSSKVYLLRIENNKTQRINIDRKNWATTKLRPYDRVIVPELERTNTYGTATIKGEINIPGEYPIITGQTSVYDLLELAGGITSQALPSAAYMVRYGQSENPLPNKFNTPLLARTSDQFSEGLEYLSEEIELSKNRVYLNLMNASELKSLKISNGDYIYIPKDDATVFIFGQVNNPGYFPYSSTSTMSVADYIQKAGGYALSADKERVFILKAGINVWKKPDETTLESGDRIYVDRLPTENLYALRTFEIQKEQLKNQRIQLIMTGITTATGIITTLVALGIIKR